MDETIYCKVEKYLPTRQTEGAVGYDLFCAENIRIKPNEIKDVNTGVSFELPHNIYALVMGRSGLTLRKNIFVHNGLIDSDYRGNVKVIIKNLGLEDFEIKKGQRIAQILFQKSLKPCLLIKDGKLDTTKRGENGFGSTDDY